MERREFTGHGLYVELCVAASSGRLRDAARSTIASPHLLLDHPSMPNGGGAMLWLEAGRIATIECYGFDDAWALDDTSFVITVRSPTEAT